MSFLYSGGIVILEYILESNRMVMESMSKLKSAEVKQLSITHDMTQKERTQCKLLVQEAKDKEQQEGQGEWIYRVWGPLTDLRIIQLKKSQ